MKKIIFTGVTALFLFSNITYTQIKVESDGDVGIGTTSPDAGFDVHLNGRVKFTPADYGYIDITEAYNNYVYVPAIIPYLASTGFVGTSSKKWGAGYFHQLYFWYDYDLSDQKFKENITYIDNPLSIISALDGRIYDLKPELFKDASAGLKEEYVAQGKDNYGFIAQEVQQVLPSLVTTDHDSNLCINTTGIIPILVEGMKEQQSEIELLNQEIEVLKSKIDQLTSENKKSGSTGYNSAAESITNQCALKQNIPNPFSEDTKIGFSIAKTANSAMITIYNMQGYQTDSYFVEERGEGSITINGNTMQPGMYLYTLIVYGQEVDTKKMILTE